MLPLIYWSNSKIWFWEVEYSPKKNNGVKLYLPLSILIGLFESLKLLKIDLWTFQPNANSLYPVSVVDKLFW